MELYVIRHAIAADAAPDEADAERRLTPDGRKRFVQCVKGLAELGVQLERVLHSPWSRAAETAELLRPITEGPLESTKELAKSPGDALLEMLSRHVEEGPLAVVGHQPWLGELIALLTIGDPEKGEVIDLKKGGVVWLEGEPKKGGMKLRAHLPPRALRALR